MKFRQWLFRKLFAAEWAQLEVVRECNRLMEEQLEKACVAHGLSLAHPRIWNVLDELARLKRGRPARFKLEGGMSPEQIGERLRGQEKSQVILAIVAHLSAKIVDLADKSTDAPRGATHLRNGDVLPAFTETERLHFCGQAAGAAEVLAELQELTAAGEEEQTEKPAA